jgi:hypothetical protein
METQRAENPEKRRQIELAIEQACYEAARSQRQCDAVDRHNRLVAAELERRWNERLLALRTLEIERDALAAGSQIAHSSDGDRPFQLMATICSG